MGLKNIKDCPPLTLGDVIIVVFLIACSGIIILGL